MQAEQGEGDGGNAEDEGEDGGAEKTKDKEHGEPNVAGREQVALTSLFQKLGRLTAGADPESRLAQISKGSPKSW